MRIARLEFGSVEKYKEEARQSLGLKLVDETGGDLRYAFRSLARNKAFTLAAVGTLALGIGANTAIFSLMDAVLVRQLPVERPEELVLLLSQRPGEDPRYGYTNALWEAIRDQQDAFSGVFAWSSAPQPFELAERGSVQNVDGFMVSGNYFHTLGVTPAAGRVIAEADDHRGCPPVAVLSYAFWQIPLRRDRQRSGPHAHAQPATVPGDWRERATLSRDGGREEVRYRRPALRERAVRQALHREPRALVAQRWGPRAGRR